MAKNSYFNENTLDELLEEIKYVYQSDKRPWVIGYSGGKDSTTVVELVYKMLLSLNENERNKNVYIVSSDTLIENPLIKIYLSKMNEALGKAATRDGLPIKSAMVTPKAKNSFWANVIGRGYPTPRMNGSFRWCTDKLKINPSAEYIKEIIKEESEEVVVLLGVRKAESIARKRRIEGRELANRLLNRHETIQDAYVYNPIVELTTEDVWDVLLRLDGGKTPWGTDNSELVSLYADADSGECPFAGIHAGGQTQSCGNSRFGCWVCTVVKEDKSLNGFIRSGHRELIPLAEFRKWLMSIRDIPEYREKKKRNGSIYKDKDGNIVKEGEIFPQKNYISNSVEETVRNVLPKYLGYSVEDILEWVKSTEAISKRLEWGAVWRNVYRRDFLNKNQIRFNPSIRLNEDSMFNAMCFSRAQKIRTLNKGFYCYTIRPSGAFMKKRDAELVGNKMALLEARSNIVNDLNERGFNFSVKDYAGSNVMSCFELIIKMPFSARRETKKYISNLLVKESIKILPFTGRKKVDIPLLALKCNLQALMIYAVNLGKLFGVQFQL